MSVPNVTCLPSIGEEVMNRRDNFAGRCLCHEEVKRHFDRVNVVAGNRLALILRYVDPAVVGVIVQGMMKPADQGSRFIRRTEVVAQERAGLAVVLIGLNECDVERLERWSSHLPARRDCEPLSFMSVD